MQCNPSFITSAKISLISFDHGVIVFVQELYRRKGGVLLHNKYFFQIGGIAEPDASFCKTVIDFVLRMVNNDDAVCGNCSFNFQKESPFDLRIIQPADMIRFGEEAFFCISISIFISHSGPCLHQKKRRTGKHSIRRRAKIIFRTDRCATRSGIGSAPEHHPQCGR